MVLVLRGFLQSVEEGTTENRNPAPEGRENEIERKNDESQPTGNTDPCFLVFSLFLTLDNLRNGEVAEGQDQEEEVPELDVESAGRGGGEQ